MKRTTIITALLLLGLVATATAAPIIEDLESTLKKSRKLTFVVTARFDEPGEIRLTGDVNGVPVEITKRVKKAGSKRTKLKVDARKLKLKKLTENLEFNLEIVLEEQGGARETRDVGQLVPVPLILVHGLGGELTPGTMKPLADALDLLEPGYETEGTRPNLVLFEYDSQGESVHESGQDLAKVVKKILKGTSFAQADIVAHSMGGLVARSAMASKHARGRVRRMILMGTPNEGTPIAYIATLGASFFADGIPLPDDLPVEAGDLIDALLAPETLAVLPWFYPTYDGWLDVPSVVKLLLPSSASKLENLDPDGPDPDADYHAIAFSGTTEETGDLFGLTGATIQGISLSLTDILGLDLQNLNFEDLPLDALVLGDGDGVVPLRSALFRDDATWSAAITEHDLGIGFHVGMYLDPRVIAEVANCSESAFWRTENLAD